MSEKFNELSESKKYSHFEKLEGFQAKLGGKVKNLLERLNAVFSSEDMENEAVERIEDIEEGSEECLFLDTEIERNGEVFNLRTVAQMEDDYDPNREKNYNEWDLTLQEEAERWLNREILVNEKIHKFFSGDRITADSLMDADRNSKNGNMFILKKTKERIIEIEEYGNIEGRALVRTLLSLQQDLDGSGMVKEIMDEEGIKTKLEMEQKVFEDYFDNFQGYMDDCKNILGGVDDHKLAEDIKNKMLSYGDIIRSCQMKKDEYSLVHGNVNFDTVVYEDGRAYLSDWRRAGTTQNRELSLIYDLGDIFNEAIERLETREQVDDFIGGVVAGIEEHYQDEPPKAEAVVNLAKLRSFSMTFNDNDIAKDHIKSIFENKK